MKVALDILKNSVDSGINLIMIVFTNIDVGFRKWLVLAEMSNSCIPILRNSHSHAILASDSNYALSALMCSDVK